jgi:hypothetical protein
MSDTPPSKDLGEDSTAPWYVYDRHLDLLHIAATLAEAEAWATGHWGVVEIADREEVASHDYWYLLFAAPQESGYSSRDFQARIIRRDRVIALRRDPNATPRYP